MRFLSLAVLLCAAVVWWMHHDEVQPLVRSPTMQPGSDVDWFPNGRGLWLSHHRFDPKGEPKASVVMVHGFAEHSRRIAYTTLGKTLASHGFQVFAFDHQGMGSSQGERGYSREFDEHVENLQTFLTKVVKQPAGRPLYVFAHSFGTVVTAGHLLKYPGTFDGAAFSGACFQVDPAEATPLLVGIAGILSRSLPRLPIKYVPADKISRDPRIVALQKADHLSTAPVRARFAADLLAAGDTIMGRLRHIALPFIALHGMADELCPVTSTAALDRNTSSTEKEVHILPGLAHELLHEPEKEMVLAKYLDWFKRRLAADLSKAKASA